MSDVKKFKGAGGGGGGSAPPPPVRTPDNLRSKDTVEILLGIAEGPIYGLVNNNKSFFIGETPLESNSGEANFVDFNLNVDLGFYPPTPIQFHLGGLSSNTPHSSVELEIDVPVVATTTSGDIDYFDLRLAVQQLFYQDDTGIYGTTASIRIEYKANSASQWTHYKDLQITGKTTSTYVREVRVPVERIQEAYNVRVTKIHGRPSETNFVSIVWESIQEIDAREWAFDNLATAHLVAQASSQFTSIPDFSGEYYGKLIKVPANYDPWTRAYDGIWDGTFKTEWSDNPAWVLYDLVMNDEYGLNAYTPVIMNKYEVYEAGQWCDELVPDGKGGLEPRFRMNITIAEPRTGYETIQMLAGSFNSIIYDDNQGNLILKVDKDEQAKHLFTTESIVGEFEYSYTDTSSRYNDLIVAFQNPERRWQEDRRRVFDQTNINQNGRVPDEFIAIGSISEGQSVRQARYRMLTANTETEVVTFQTNRRGIFVEPFEIILISDPDMGYALSGRISSLNEARTVITLRDSLYLEVGVTYQIQVQLNDEIFTATITGHSAGENTSLTLSTALPADVPANAVFAVVEENSVGAPKPYRVISIEETDGSPDQYKITAIEINRDKWADVDNFAEEGDFDHSDVVTEILPPSNIRFEEEMRPTPFGYSMVLVISWDRSPSFFTRHYRVMVSRNGGPSVELGITDSNSIEYPDIPPGLYTFEIYAVGATGRQSYPLIGEYDFRRAGGSTVPQPTNLRVEDETEPGVFSTQSPVFLWDLSAPEPYLRHYRVRILDADTFVVLRTEQVVDRRYQYTFENNASDDGGPRRRFRIEIQTVTLTNESSDPAILVVENSPPGLPSNISVVPAFNAIHVGFIPPPDLDWRGTLIWLSTDPAFTPDSSNLVYDGPDTRVMLNVLEGATYYLRFASYDVFGKTGLTISGVWQVEVGTLADFIDLPGFVEDISENISEILDPIVLEVEDLKAQAEAAADAAEAWVIVAEEHANDAGTSAAASAASASVATGYADDAEAFALAADLSRLDAEAASTSAGTSASAAADSATLASAKADEAGASATAANTSKLSAETAAATATASSLTAVQAAEDAEGHAQAAVVNVDTLRATVEGGTTRNIVQNPIFDNWPATNPNGFGFLGAGRTKITDPANVMWGNFSLQVAASGGSNQAFSITASNSAQWVGPINSSHYIIEAEFTLVSGGNLSGAGIRASFTGTSTTQHRDYPFRDHLTAVNGNTYSVRFRAETHSSQTVTGITINWYTDFLTAPIGPRAAKTIIWHSVSVRPVSAVEAALITESAVRATETSALSASVTSLTVNVDNNTASVATAQQAIIDLDNLVQAQYVLTVDVNGNIAGFRAVADQSSSSLTFVANQFYLANASAQAVLPFSVQVFDTIPTLVIAGNVRVATTNSGDRVELDSTTNTIRVWDGTDEYIRIGRGLSAPGIYDNADMAIVDKLSGALLYVQNGYSNDRVNGDAISGRVNSLSSSLSSGVAGVVLGGPGRGVVGSAGTTSSGHGVRAVGAANNTALYATSTNGGNDAHAIRGSQLASGGGSGLVGVTDGGGGFGLMAESGGVGQFTGAHPVLIPRMATFEIGDVLVLDEVLGVHDFENISRLVKLSTKAMDPTVVGVFWRAYELELDEPEELDGLSDNQIDYMARQVEELDRTQNKPPLTPAEVKRLAAAEKVRANHRRVPAGLRSLPLEQVRQLAAIYRQAKVAALGEGQVRVCGQGGPIKAGDLLCTSDVPGAAMKQPGRKEPIWEEDENGLPVFAGWQEIQDARPWTFAQAWEDIDLPPGQTALIACGYGPWR